MTDHSPTPWRIEHSAELGHHMIDANGDPVPISPKNLARIVHCVNACDGMATDDIWRNGLSLKVAA